MSGAATTRSRTVEHHDENVGQGKEHIAARDWARLLVPYQGADTRQAVLELGITLGLFAITWVGAALSFSQGLWWLGALMIVPAAGSLVRLFMLQHDCGHYSFFKTRRANDIVGRCLGVLTMTPYDYWRQSHAVHHATSGNLDRRGTGDIETLTVREYEALSLWGRFTYRLGRHPLVLLGVGPTYIFVLKHRLPLDALDAGKTVWMGILGTNLGIAAIVGAGCWLMGVGPFLAVYLPTGVLAATAGIWLFYVQHQFEETHWQEAPDWQFHDAAFHGSSFYDLPPVISWFTANIGLHHVHHLSSRIPCYRLGNVLRDMPELGKINRITFKDGLSCFRLALWDEHHRRMIGFGDLKRSRRGEGAAALAKVAKAALPNPALDDRSC